MGSKSPGTGKITLATIAAVLFLVVVLSSTFAFNKKANDSAQNDTENYVTTADTETAETTAESSQDTDISSYDWDSYRLDKKEVFPELALPNTSIYRDGKAVCRVCIEDDGEGTEECAEYFIYDDEGRVTKRTSYYMNGTLRAINLYEYTDGGVVKVDIITSVVNAKYKGYSIMHYNEAGLVVKEERFTSGCALQLSVVYEYGENNRLEKFTKYSSGGAITSYTDYVYDEAGREIEENQHDPDGVVALQTVTSYDAEGRIAKKEQYFDGTLTMFIEYVYDENGDCTMYKNQFVGGTDGVFKRSIYTGEED